jgi:chemotaxis protein methyltransferase CheR
LRIWSAACCTGEEPVSILIALAEAGILDRYPVEVVGSDASRAMVERARDGRYGERSFRQLSPELKAKYFEPESSGRWRPLESLTRRIEWHVANLVDPAQVAPYATADVIFCRNVFIYFSDTIIRQVAIGFADRMPDDGYLFLGASESLTRLGVNFELAEMGGGFVYVKPGRRAAVERGARPPGATAAHRTAP